MKSGFFSIGYVENKGYAAEMRRLCGTNIDYRLLDEYVDAEWQDRYNRCLCWDERLEPADSHEKNIAYMMVDTGYVTTRGEKIYGGFTTRRFKGLEKDSNWQGVSIGTQESILEGWHTAGGSLRSYTFLRDFNSLERVLNSMTGKNLAEETWETVLQSAFDEAQRTGRLGVYQGTAKGAISYYPLGETTLAGEPIWLTMEANLVTGAQPWFGLMAKGENELLEKILDMNCYHLGSMIFEGAGAANAFLQQLAELAMDEVWTASPAGSPSYGILRSYITHTLYRLEDEDVRSEGSGPRHVDEVDGKIYFNSGLLSRLFRQIIIVGERCDIELSIEGMGKRTYRMIKNPCCYSESDREIANIYDGEIYKLPPIARYFTDYREIMFDARYAIKLNDLHIFEDGVERKRLPKYDEEYQRCKDNPEAKNMLLARIARDFDSAIQRAKLLAERNYKLAVPQFWRETGEIQFLLPIYLGELEEADRPQCALALSLDRSGRVPYYRGATILTLDMAYNNARLIAKPDVFWLDTTVKSET